MMSGATIANLARKAARNSSRAGKSPLIVEAEDMGPRLAEHMQNIPFLGYRTPRGWRKVQTFFVDSSGSGEEGEGALTFEQFLAVVRPDHAYSVYEAGQFQVVIAEFAPLSRQHCSTCPEGGRCPECKAATYNTGPRLPGKR